MKAVILALAAFVASASSEPPAVHAAEAILVDDDKPAKPVKEDLLVLEALAGDEDGVFGEAGYKIKRRGELTIKEFEVEVAGAPAGTRHEVLLNGTKVATMRIGRDGEGEIELIETDEVYFPEGFPAKVGEGAIVEVGDLIRFELYSLQRLADLKAVHEDGDLKVQAKFKLEKIGPRVLKQLKIEIRGGTDGAVYPVSIDGVFVTEVSVKAGGTAKLKLGTGEDPLPAGFVDPRAGSIVTLGDAFQLELASQLEEHDA